MITDYIKIARPDHWIKQLFILPGAVIAVFLMNPAINVHLFISLLLALLSTCFTASANYVINEWLDAQFDQYHPTKKNRPVVAHHMNPAIVYTEYFALAVLGLLCAAMLSKTVLIMQAALFLMGIVYNVKPLRSKDIPYLDVLSESVNNAIRLLIGWFTVSSAYLPPVSIVLGYWMGGAFLMAIKRYAEYRMINDPEVAGRYRRSFQYYSEKKLLISGFFYALMSVFFCGIFMIKYKIELIFAIPLVCGLFCYYLGISYKEDSSVQKPEKLYKEKGLMLYLLLLFAVVCLLMLWHSNGLQVLLETSLIGAGTF